MLGKRNRIHEEKVILCRSMKFERGMQSIVFILAVKHNFNVLQCVYNVDNRNITQAEKKVLEKEHYRKIEISDANYVVDI